jgi:multiple sugar transport system ATP-binding protein
MASVTLRGITHRYYEGSGSVTAVEDIDLGIEDGEFVVLVGPSGCGKSTTLEILSGLSQPTEGRVFFGDEDVTNQPARKRDIAMVFQNYALYPHMTVEENMAFPLKQRGDVTGRESARAVEDAASTMGIDEKLDRLPGDLSGGQRQRVALGRAIVRDPEVFLMDEPLSNLDAKLRREMRVELQELHAALETTTIYVTHNQEEAMTMADEIVILKQGEIQQVGPPQRVYENPANRFVADFMGEPSMNFFRGRIIDGDPPSFDFEGQRTDPIPLSNGSVRPDQEVTFSIRPEHIDPVDPEESDIFGEAALIEPMGSHFEAHVTLDSGDSVIAMLDPDTRVREGDRLGLRFDRTRVHLFDAATGARVD